MAGDTIKHKHLIIRAECRYALMNTEEEKRHLNTSLRNLIADLGMVEVLPSRAFYVEDVGNEGWTGNAGLSTSHVAYHIWNKPEKSIMVNENATLIQFDVYTCGCLDKEQVQMCIDWVDDAAEIISLEYILMDRASTFVEQQRVSRLNYEKE